MGSAKPDADAGVPVYAHRVSTHLDVAEDAQRQLDTFEAAARSWRVRRDMQIRLALRDGSSEREVAERLRVAPSLVHRIRNKR